MKWIAVPATRGVRVAMLAAIGLMTSCGDENPQLATVSSTTVLGGACVHTYCAEAYEESGFCPLECSTSDCLCCGVDGDPLCDGGDGGGGGGAPPPAICPRPPGSQIVNMLYEGSCNFLANCSAPAKECLQNGTCQPGQVPWGYCGVGECSALGGFHMAAPSGHSCNQDVEICRFRPPCTCTGGVIADKSDRNRWEGGPRIFEELDQPHSGDNCTGGFGHMTVYVRTLN